MKTVNGKKPVAQKSTASTELAIPSFFTNKLDVPAAIKADIESKGLELRWISYKKFVNDGNQHKFGWTPYKSEKTNETAFGFQVGSNPDGILRREDALLAVRPKEYGVQHRELNRQRLKRQTQSAHSKSRADELRQMAKEANMDAKIYEGYEDNG